MSEKTIEELQEEAAKRYSMGEWEGARRIFDEILDQDPENSFALNKIGVIMAQRGKFQDAESYIRQALEADPENEAAYNNLGNVFLERGAVREAIMCYENAIEIDDNYSRAYHNLAVAYKKEGNLDRYVKTMKKSQKVTRHREKEKSAETIKTVSQDATQKVGGLFGNICESIRSMLGGT